MPCQGPQPSICPHLPKRHAFCWKIQVDFPLLESLVNRRTPRLSLLGTKPMESTGVLESRDALIIAVREHTQASLQA